MAERKPINNPSRLTPLQWNKATGLDRLIAANQLARFQSRVTTSLNFERWGSTESSALQKQSKNGRDSQSYEKADLFAK